MARRAAQLVPRSGRTLIDRHGISYVWQLECNHLCIADLGEVTVWIHGAQLYEQEAQLRQVKLDAPVGDHRREAACVLVRRLEIRLALVPAVRARSHVVHQQMKPSEAAPAEQQ
jgi:hypothetical protein